MEAQVKIQNQLQVKPSEQLDPSICLALSDNAGVWWSNDFEGADIHKDLYAALVPDEGEADTVHGMLLLAANKIYYDIYNNGGCNLVKDISQEHSSYEEEDEEGCYEEPEPEPEHELDVAGVKLFGDLERWMPTEHQDCVKEAIKATLDYDNRSPSIAFDHLLDRVIYTVLTTTNIANERECVAG